MANGRTGVFNQVTRYGGETCEMRSVTDVIGGIDVIVAMSRLTV